MCKQTVINKKTVKIKKMNKPQLIDRYSFNFLLFICECFETILKKLWK